MRDTSSKRWIWLGLSVLAGCTERGRDTKDQAQITVSPTSINFGASLAGESSAETVTVSNVGADTLTLTGLELEGSHAFELYADGILSSLEPGETTGFDVLYTATGDVDEGAVIVHSSDPAFPELTVELIGGTTAVLVWSPDPLDFGEVEVGERPVETVTLQNAGDDDLNIETLTLEGDAFEAELPSTPLTLGPGESTSLEVGFVSDVAGAHTGALIATANASEDLRLDLQGVVQGEVTSGPVAVCSVDPDVVSRHSETATWIGEESYDPGGAAIVDYDWTLIALPTGSSAIMPGGDANRTGFVWDLAGEYVGQLVVTNEDGLSSEPCTATLTATPTDQLWVELYWEVSGDDMDLHLVAPGGTLETDSDCFWANCSDGFSPDWGVPGAAEDNPSLDLDDISGTGPENIRLAAPEDGVFTVVVHDFPSTIYEGSNTVWVLIYTGGVLAYEQSCAISGEDTYTEFATVDFPSGTVTSSDPCP